MVYDERRAEESFNRIDELFVQYGLLEDDDSETTETPSYECGASMEECNQAYQDAMSVTCPPTEAPTMGTSLYVSTASDMSTDDLTDPLSNWMFNQQNNNGDVQTAFSLNDGNTLAVVENEYVVVDGNGRVYPTCVQHGGSGDACDASLICWNGNTAGSASEQRSALLQAAERNDFKNANCVSQTCAALSGYYEDQFVSRGLPEGMTNNLCVSNDALFWVTRDAQKHVCIGFGEGTSSCPSDMNEFYVCSGSNDGLQTFGWPGQFSNACTCLRERPGKWIFRRRFIHPPTVPLLN